MENESIHIKNSTISINKTVSSSPALTLVFIHGFPFNKSIWDLQMEFLPESVTGLAYDIRGFGNSKSEHNFLSIDLFAKDLLELINSLDSQRIILCGISMGGYIALRTLEMSNPKIIGLILCDTNAVSDTNEAKIKRFQSIDKIQSGSKESFVDDFINKVFSKTTLNTNPGIVNFLKDNMMSSSDDVICATLMALAARTDTSDFLKNIEVPVLILRGEEDQLMSEEQANQLATIPQSEIIHLHQSGHLPNLENPDDFNKAIITYLNKHFLY